MVNEFSLEKIRKRTKTFPEISSNPIILFGAGAGGVTYLDLIKSNSPVQILFCDNNPRKWGTKVHGVPVISFDELKKNYSDSQIVITSPKYYEEILQSIVAHNMKDNLSRIGFDILYNKIYDNYLDLVQQKFSDFSLVYNMLTDEYSKQTFNAIIEYYILADAENLRRQKSKAEQYFETDILPLSEKEIFVDGGAYTGDTIEQLFLYTHGKAEKIYAFEPDESKHKLLQKKFGEDEFVSVWPYGLWSKKDMLQFELGSQENSCINRINVDGSSTLLIPVISIDDALSGKPATFIKMDIEGAELEALQGAEQTIKRYRPKLAICVYHNPLDIIEIPLYIKSLVPEYKLYLRHYSGDHSETVLYAVL